MAMTEKTTRSSVEFSPDSQPGRAPVKSRIRVWLTDDNVGFRNMLAHLLERAGEFECERQFDSAESLLAGLAHEPSPDVILLDIEMGGISGVEALRPIRLLAPNVRVLILTTFFDPMNETRASRDGASAFLLKAVAAQNIAGEIHRALTSPVHLQDFAPAPSSPEAARRIYPDVKLVARSDYVARKSRAGRRLASWMMHLSSALFGLIEYHRSATPE